MLVVQSVLLTRVIKILHQQMDLLGPAHVDWPLARQVLPDTFINFCLVHIRKLLYLLNAVVPIRESTCILLQHFLHCFRLLYQANTIRVQSAP